MTDRELLELAAKAAGFGTTVPVFGVSPFMGLRLIGGALWNPIQDSGDAFRLMVHLNLDVEHQWVNPSNPAEELVLIYSEQLGVKIYQQYGDNREQAVRLAITLAAAQIGKGMS